MKVIHYGNNFELYNDSVKVFDKLPPASYIVRFNKMTGFYLEKYNEIEIKEEKIYGVHTEKVEKVLRKFNKINRNLGVILSGNKGIGKSLFAKLLSKMAIENGYPLIVVDCFYPGIASYLEEIEQEVVVLFDEFDKTFGEVSVGDGEASPQSTLLTLFDGLAIGKKMFVITCNELRKLNDYLVNRPGRFHYHFRFDYPSVSEIREYLEDKLEKQYYKEIDKVITFSKKVNLNYDCLRAIASELNDGEKFEDAILDLNIVNTESELYDITLYFTNGESMKAHSETLDLFGAHTKYVNLYDDKDRDIISVTFNTSNCIFDTVRGNIVPKENLNIRYDEDYYSEEEVAKVKELEVAYLSITRHRDKSLHYLL